MAAGFGMQVKYRYRSFWKRSGGGCDASNTNPQELLKVSDIVSIHVPLLPQTEHLINAERLAS